MTEEFVYSTGQVNAKGQVICGAKNRQGKPCRATQLYPNGRCHKHGGPSLKGIASPSFVTGRYSKYAQSLNLVERLQDMADDPKRLELDEEIDVARSRVAELIGRVKTGESRELVKRLRDTWRQMQTAAKAKDGKEVAIKTAEMESLIFEAWGDYAVYGDLDRWLDRVQSLVESQRKREIEAQRVYTADEFGMMMARVIDILTAEILVDKLPPPRQLMSRLVQRFAELEGATVIEGEVIRD